MPYIVPYFERTKSWRCSERKSFSVREHIHDRIEIIYLRTGKTTVTVDDVSYELKPGDITVSFPYQVHSITDGDEPLTGIALLFPPDFIADSGLSMRDKQPKVARIENEESRVRIAALLEKLVSDGACKNEGEMAIRKGLCIQLMGEIFCASEFVDTGKTNQRILRSVIDYCYSHYTEDISLDRMHRELFVSKYYISYLFSKKMKISFTRFINSLRISDACRLLEDRGEKISEIATSVGFSSVRTFNRAFSDVMGMTPGEYRMYKNV